jgi:hypothetical protein
MKEKQIKAIIAKKARKYGLAPVLLEAVAMQEFVKLYGWTTEGINRVHADGTSFGMFGLRESTSVAEYTDRKGSPETNTLEGQAEVAAWYLGKRIPQMLEHYKLEKTISNVITAYNAGISRAISGEIPTITQGYIEFVESYTAEKKSSKIPLAILAVISLIFGALWWN